MDKAQELPRRKKNRWENYDYSSCGGYFITVCTLDRQNYLGKAVGAITDRPYDLTGHKTFERVCFKTNRNFDLAKTLS